MANKSSLVNGRAYHFTNITVEIPNYVGSIPFISITAVEYSRSRKKTNLMANTPEPESRAYGEYEYAAKLSMYKHMADKLREGAPGKSLVDLPRFNVIVEYKEDSEAPITRDVIRDCEFTDETQAASKGDDGGMENSYTLLPGSITFGGQGGLGVSVGFSANQAFIGL